MEREVRVFLYSCLFIGLVFGVGVGIAAGDRGMITGVIAAFIGGAIVAPFAARMWR
jgi:hypothetical protein